MRKKVELTAVWDDDLHALLDSLGILKDLNSGKAHCIVCGSKVDTDNLGTIMPSVNTVRFTCDDTSCVQAVTSRETLVTNGR